jgi:IclR family transcriptional regulator, KDG regulon repressor
MSEPSSVKTVDRLVTVLDCFTPDRPSWSLAELSVRLSLPKSTLHRFLTSLESHGILRRNAEDKRWRLGYRLFLWGCLAEESTSLREVVRPVLTDLATETGETAILTVYRGHEVICIDLVETQHSVRLALSVGQRRPPHAGASSKVLLAYQPRAEIEAVLNTRSLPQLCTNTLTDVGALTNELAEIRRVRYGISIEETDPDAWGVATPVYDRAGQVVAAIGVAGPNSRFSQEKTLAYAHRCTQAAKRISALLGGASSLSL